jgi:hypothetical protein
VEGNIGDMLKELGVDDLLSSPMFDELKKSSIQITDDDGVLLAKRGYGYEYEVTAKYPVNHPVTITNSVLEQPPESYIKENNAQVKTLPLERESITPQSSTNTTIYGFGPAQWFQNLTYWLYPHYDEFVAKNGGFKNPLDLVRQMRFFQNDSQKVTSEHIAKTEQTGLQEIINTHTILPENEPLPESVTSLPTPTSPEELTTYRKAFVTARIPYYKKELERMGITQSDAKATMYANFELGVRLSRSRFPTNTQPIRIVIADVEFASTMMDSGYKFPILGTVAAYVPNKYPNSPVADAGGSVWPRCPF